MPEYDIATTGEDQISDLIEVPPSWLLRSGISSLSIVVVLVVGLTVFIRYPDKITAKGIITTEVPPIALVTQEAGRVERLFVQDKAFVAKDTPILFIHNEASLEDVDALRSQLERVRSLNDPAAFLSTSLPEAMELGMMQGDYLRLKQQLDALKLMLAQAEVEALQTSRLTHEVREIEKLNKSLTKEKTLYEEELVLKEKDFQRQKSLKESGVISELEYEQAESLYLQFMRQYEAKESGIINNQIRIEQLQMKGIEMGAAYSQKVQTLHIEIQQIIALLEAQLLVWEEKYFIKAEVDGTVSLAKGMEENAFFDAGSLAAYIIPSAMGEMLTKVNVPIQSSGKVETGQRLILKIPAYPYKEYGVLTTEVADIAAIALVNSEGEAYYEIKGSLPQQLESSYGKIIPYKPNMQVTAEIISEDRSLFQRIFNQFFDLLKNE